MSVQHGPDINPGLTRSCVRWGALGVAGTRRGGGRSAAVAPAGGGACGVGETEKGGGWMGGDRRSDLLMSDAGISRYDSLGKFSWFLKLTIPSRRWC